MSGRNIEKESNAQIESTLPSHANMTARSLITPMSARRQLLEQQLH